MEYFAPEYKAKSFNCPHCNTRAHHHWYGMAYATLMDNGYVSSWNGLAKNYDLSQCISCENFAIWYQNKLIFPHASIAPFPSEDMPEDIAKDFNEARNILNQSPRSSTALLRLVVQKLCIYLGLPGKDLNTDIGTLVKRGLSVHIQKALDTVRVIGNNAVHPGILDLRDDQPMALKLFKTVNYIVYEMITRPHELEEMYNDLPEGALKGIERRDGSPK